MGLDIVLGLMILVGAVRGWLRGFVIQAIRLAGLVGSVYAAAPVRDYARPYIQRYLVGIRPDLLDRLLWWSAAVLIYVLSVGLASLAVKMVRRRPFGEVEPNRTDQFAGFLLGGIKGAIVVAFFAASLDKYAVERLKGLDWADEQAKGSYALLWESQYRPADRIWASVPVRHFVTQVKRMGIQSPAESSESGTKVEPQPIQAATTGGAPRLELELPKFPALDPGSSNFNREFDRLFDELTPKRP